MDCPYCTMPYMEWRMDEIVSKNKLFDTNIGIWHDCQKSPQAKKKKKHEEFLKKRESELLEMRKEKVRKLKTPVFCHSCGKALRPNQPCEHMIADGFEIGVDGGDFYADTFKAEERRKYLKNKRKEDKKMKLEKFF